MRNPLWSDRAVDMSSSTLSLQITRLATEVGERLLPRALTVTTAESCTGGGVSYALTAIAGSSRWFERSFVTYSNAAKQEMLQVDGELLVHHGAVSEPVVQAMASGALQAARASIAVAISGIAGPDGGTADKPVGLVWMAWAKQLPGETTPQIVSRACHFAGDREQVREQAILTALQGICDFIQ